MLESITIFHRGGLILYQYRANPSIVGAEGDVASALFTETKVNAWMQRVLLGRKQDPNQAASQQPPPELTKPGAAMMTDFVAQGDKFAVALYPDLMFDGPRAYLKTWIKGLLEATMKEYELYEKSQQQQENENLPARPDPTLFDKTFLALLEKSKHEKSKLGNSQPPDPTAAANNELNTTNNKTAKKGKEKRNWHDGKAKVTKEAMAELDFSKADSNTANATEGTTMDPSDQAIAEARAAYLPNYNHDDGYENNDDDQVDTDPDLTDENSWGSSLKSIMDQMTGNKVLTAKDIQAPLEELQRTLTSKNVAQGVAQEICDGVRKQLLGKRLNSFYRVQTAVRQGLEASITQLLSGTGKNRASNANLDIIRAAMAKKNSGGGVFRTNASPPRPYVVVVVGINGVGKSTSLAKLAYYFQSHQLHPLLVAGDTFRSGAVEQLNVHAKCLDIPLFHQGYAKDPSVVAKGAIAQAMNADRNDPNKPPIDVVLIDTAGRMQNNTPLMNALGKLVKENQPDLILLVAEALVGNDGVDQLQMFNRAMQNAKRQVDAVILTKFDTVSDKVGAALTMTHVTGAPILFVGTGQKYHHLKPLKASAVIKSLFS